MAQLDVSDLLLDPLFIDNVVFIHRTSSIDMYGVTVLTELTSSTVGSVQPVSGKDLQRLPESLRMADVRTFYIKAEILSDGSSQYPDLIQFQGFRYEVQSVDNWLNYGQGFNSGICVKQLPSQ